MLRVLRIYHGGRNSAHRSRERLLALAYDADMTLVVPSEWPEADVESRMVESAFSIRELPVIRAGDVNRHSYRSKEALGRLIAEVRPDVLDIHEEPFSVVARQWLSIAPRDLPIVMYAAQNVDKRFPPPFSQYERDAYRRVAALYPCSAQAASVARGKGFTGLIDVLPLGYDDDVFTAGAQSLDDELVLGLVGRLVPEKGVVDAIQVLAHMHALRPTRLVIAGEGSEEAPARALAAALGVLDRVEFMPWRSTTDLSSTYRLVHIVLVPSRPTDRWVEQFGRVIVEAQASGAVVAGYASGAIEEVAGDAAVLVRVGSVSCLGDRIAELLSAPSRYARLRERGFALSRTRTWACVAARHAAIYRRAAAGDFRRVVLPRSPKRRRAEALSEFGPPAASIAGSRPFALPILRRGGPVATALAVIVDAGAEFGARL